MPPATTPTQGQLPIHPQQQHRYHSNHHSPSPVPPPPPPPTCTAGVVGVPIGQGVIPQQQGSLQQQPQVTYIAHQPYNLGDPLQALQAIRPVTNTAGSATLPYSTLNVSVGNNTTALPRGVPVVQQSFSQLPGGQKPQQQQHVLVMGGYQQQVATPLGVGGQGVAKNLSTTAGISASSLPGATRVGSGGVTSFQQQMSVLAGVGGIGIQPGVMQRIVTGTRIGSATQVIGNVRTGQQPGLAAAQQTLGGQSYLTPPPAKRTAYDLSSYRPSGVLPQTTSLLSAQSLTGLNQQSSHHQQLTAKPPSLLPPTTNSLTINRLPSLMGQQQQQQAQSVLYRTNSQTQHTAAALLGAAAVASQLPGGAGQQVSALSSLTQVGGRGGLPGQQQVPHLGGVGVGAGVASGTPVVRPVSGLPQPQPSPTARPQSGFGGGLQQNYGAASGSGRGATWR
jgi:hypothetical protein